MIRRPCYCSRDEAMRALDFKDGVLAVPQVDRALESAADDIEGALHRQFYPWDGVHYFNWPNHQYAEPWRLWLDRHDLQCLTALQSPGGVGIPLWQVFLEPVNRWRGWCYTHIELDRSTVAAWGIGPTPQHAIWPVGTWGFTADADQAAVLAADIDASDTTVTISDGSRCGAGDVLIIGYGRGTAPFPAYPGTAGAIQPYLGERIIVQDKGPADAGLTLSGAGCTTATNSDTALTVTGGSLNAGEVVLVDQELMLVERVVAGVATVARGWAGSILSTHTTGADAYPDRQLTVMRGELGTTAAAATTATSVHRHRVPPLVRDLAIAITVDQVLQEPSGYSRTVGAGEAQMRATGYALANKWNDVVRRYGRTARKGTI